MDYQLIKTEYLWGLCPQAAQALPVIAVSVSAVITVKVIMQFMVWRKNKKQHCEHDH